MSNIHTFCVTGVDVSHIFLSQLTSTTTSFGFKVFLLNGHPLFQPPICVSVTKFLKALYESVSFTCKEHTDVGVAVKWRNKLDEKIPSESTSTPKHLNNQNNTALSRPSSLKALFTQHYRFINIHCRMHLTREITFSFKMQHQCWLLNAA